MVEQAKHKKLWVHACVMLALMVVFHVIPPLGVITEVGMRLIGVFLAMLYGWDDLRYAMAQFDGDDGCSAERRHAYVRFFGTQLRQRNRCVYFIYLYLYRRNR